MKILMLTSRYGSGYGMGYSAYKEAVALSELGHTVTVILCNSEPDLKTFNDARIKLVHLSISKIPVVGLAMFYFTINYFFNKKLNLLNFDIIYLQSLEFGWINFKKVKIPVFYFARSTMLAQYEVFRRERVPLAFSAIVVKYLLVYLERRCLIYSKTVFVKSSIMKAEIHKLYGVNYNKIVVINGGIDLKDFSPLSDHRLNDIKHELGIPRECFVFLYAGRIVPQKGLMNLIKAALLLLPKYDFVLVIAGSNFNKNYFKKIIDLIENSKYRDSFYLLGHIDQLKMSTIYNIADCVVTPSLYEPFGMVNLQAAFLGKRVITTKVTGSIELLHDYPNLTVIQSGSAEALAVALKKILTTTGYNKQYCDFSKYSWINVAKQIAGYFNLP